MLELHRIVIFTSAVAIGLTSCSEVNEKINLSIQEAGCHFYNNRQFLHRNVCLMPNYHSNESPENIDGVSNVDIRFAKVKVLEVNEKKNKVTFLISQYMEWKDRRIRANFSAITSRHIKLPPKKVTKIWHPNLDMFTPVSYTHLTLPTIYSV